MFSFCHPGIRRAKRLKPAYILQGRRAAKDAGLHLGVVYPERQSLKRAAPLALTSNRFQTRWYEEQGIPTLRQHGWNLWWRLPYRFDERIHTTVRMVDDYVEREGRPDLIHAQSARWAAAAARRAAKRYDIPYSVTEHFTGFQRGIIDAHQRRLVEAGFEAAGRIATVSGSLRDVLVAQGWVAPDRIDAIPNYVDESLFTLPPNPRRGPQIRLLDVTSLETPPWHLPRRSKRWSAPAISTTHRCCVMTSFAGSA